MAHRLPFAPQSARPGQGGATGNGRLPAPGVVAGPDLVVMDGPGRVVLRGVRMAVVMHPQRHRLRGRQRHHRGGLGWRRGGQVGLLEQDPRSAGVVDEKPPLKEHAAAVRGGDGVRFRRRVETVTTTWPKVTGTLMKADADLAGAGTCRLPQGGLAVPGGVHRLLGAGAFAFLLEVSLDAETGEALERLARDRGNDLAKVIRRGSDFSKVNWEAVRHYLRRLGCLPPSGQADGADRG